MRWRVHWLFAALLGLLVLVGHWREGALLLFALAAHELAHLAAATVLEVGVEGLLLTPLGASIELARGLEDDPQAETVIALAGPFQSALLAALVLPLARLPAFDPALARLFFEFNLSLAFFNLLPALPLDGGRALRATLARRWGYRTVTQVMVGVGRGLGLVLCVGGLAVLLLKGLFLPTPLVGGLYLFYLAGLERAEASLAAYRGLLTKGQLVAKGPLPAQFLVVGVEVTLGELAQRLARGKYHLVLVVDDQMQVIGQLTEADLAAAFRRAGPMIKVGQLLP